MLPRIRMDCANLNREDVSKAYLYWGYEKIEPTITNIRFEFQAEFPPDTALLRENLEAHVSRRIRMVQAQVAAVPNAGGVKITCSVAFKGEVLFLVN